MGRIRSSNQAEIQRDAAYAIEPGTDGLLLNWGRWLAGRSRGSATGNAMWRFASRGTRAATYATLSVPADADQARRVEVVVCNPDFSHKLRDVLKAHYVVNAHPTRTCAALGLHQAAYAEWVWRATVYFDQRYRAAYRDILVSAA